MRRTSCLFLVSASVLFWATGAAGEEPETRLPATTAPEVVVIPTIGNDHQFNLDYTVAHLMAVMDAVSPDALLVSDYTDWLRCSCIWFATRPEIHVALAFAEEKSVPIWGTLGGPPAPAHDEAAKMAEWYKKMYPDVESIRDSAQDRLNQNTARIAREYSFNPEPQTLRKLVEVGFEARAGKWTAANREAFALTAKQVVDSLTVTVTSNPQPRRWAVLLRWEHALIVEESLRESQEVQYRSVREFLPRMEGALENRMNARHLAWILSGILDEWYGMWAPQVFPGRRIAALLARLEHLAPDDPATRFLWARWLMQNRDYEAAEPILAKLSEDRGDARFPFPMNGKWIRPPWSSVRDKAKLNLAFVYDVLGKREDALRIYGELLVLGEKLNAEARAVGYVYDDIRWVIESYTKDPYTGMPEEAYRHFPMTAGVPACDPGARVAPSEEAIP